MDLLRQRLYEKGRYGDIVICAGDFNMEPPTIINGLQINNLGLQIGFLDGYTTTEEDKIIDNILYSSQNANLFTKTIHDDFCRFSHYPISLSVNY
jgi:putative lipase involved disintegration of autophagic bodies